MKMQNLHTHTKFEDGHCTHEEMAQAAFDAGFSSLGFSFHSELPTGETWPLLQNQMPEYFAELEKAKEKFAGRMPIYSGIEWDGMSDPNLRNGRDYVIGSLHYITIGAEHYCMDSGYDIVKNTLENVFNGNPKKMTEAYYSQYEAFCSDPAIDIIGHFDVLSKFCENNDTIDIYAPYYMMIATDAMKGLIKADKIFEVNTGGMFQKRRSEQYPSMPLLLELKLRGARMTINTDAHSKEQIAYKYLEMAQLLKDIGFKEIWQFDGKEFVPEAL